MADLQPVTDESFESEVLNAAGGVIVEFWATWCVPCKTITPSLEKLAERYDGRLRVVKIDAEANARTSSLLQVRSVPTVIAFKSGREVERFMGVRSISTFSAMADKLLSSDAS